MLRNMPCRQDVSLQCPSQKTDNQPEWSKQTKNNDRERQIRLRNINFIFVWKKVWVIGEGIYIHGTSLSGKSIFTLESLSHLNKAIRKIYLSRI
jgi:hypothetical protein